MKEKRLKSEYEGAAERDMEICCARNSGDGSGSRGNSGDGSGSRGYTGDGSGSRGYTGDGSGSRGNSGDGSGSMVSKTNNIAKKSMIEKFRIEKSGSKRLRAGRAISEAEREPLTDRQVESILDTLRQREEIVTTAESITAGMISARITDIPGSSDVLRRAFVTYSDESKHEMLRVRNGTLRRRGAVSRQVARQMAKGAAKKAHAEASVSVTGYAGPPSGPDDVTAGHVFIGCFYHGKVVIEEHNYSGSRHQVRQKTVDGALRLLASCIGLDL